MVNWFKKIFSRGPVVEMNSSLDLLSKELKETHEEYKTALQEAKAVTKIVDTRRRIRALKDDVADAEDAVEGDVCEHGKTDDEECAICDAQPDTDGLGSIDDEIKSILMRPLLEKMKGVSMTSRPSTAEGESSIIASAPQGRSLTPLQQKAIDAVKNASDDDIRKFF